MQGECGCLADAALLRAPESHTHISCAALLAERACWLQAGTPHAPASWQPSHTEPAPLPLTGFLGSLLPLLEENLPRVWTAVSGGLAEPVSGALGAR